MKGLALVLLLLAGALCVGCTSLPGESSPSRASSGATVATTGDRIARAALDLVGTPYVYGGNTPEGFDCSGLVEYVHSQLGIRVPRTSVAQFNSGRAADRLQVGDVIFFRIGGKVSHSGIYIGNGRFVHAPSSGQQVSVARTDNAYFRPRFVGARRYF